MLESIFSKGRSVGSWNAGSADSSISLRRLEALPRDDPGDPDDPDSIEDVDAEGYVRFTLLDFDACVA